MQKIISKNNLREIYLAKKKKKFFLNIFKNKKFFPRNEQGFMMIEAVFSVFIIGTILIVFMNVMSSIFHVEFAKRDLIIATNLAQEGIEIVRNARDNNWKDGKNAFCKYDATTDPTCHFTGNGSHCVGYGNSSINGFPCPAVELKKDANGLYGYGSGTATKFKRNVVIGGNLDLKNVTVTVSWDSNEVKMTDILYAWADAD